VSLSVVALALPLRVDAQDPSGPFSFEQLIDRAPVIVVATTISRRAEWEYYGASKLIITRVALDIEDTLKGSAPRTLTIEVVGGTIGDETLRVSDVPEFHVGDRDVLFLNNAPHAVSPLVGSGQGRFRVLRESSTGTSRMVTAGFAPLLATSDVGAASTALRTSLLEAMPLSEFVTVIRDRVRMMGRGR
jgi:hypothetical protein